MYKNVRTNQTFKDLYLRKATTQEGFLPFVGFYSEVGAGIVTWQEYLGFNDTEFELFSKGKWEELFVLLDTEVSVIRFGDYVKAQLHGVDVHGWVATATSNSNSYLLIEDTVEGKEIWVTNSKITKLPYKYFPLNLQGVALHG